MRCLDHVTNEWFDLAQARDDAPRVLRPRPPAPDAPAAELAAYVRLCQHRQMEQEHLRRALPEVVLHGVLMNEVDYVQMTGRKDEQGRKIRVHFWQMPLLLDNILVCFSGRDCGKSTVLKWSVEHRVTNFPTGSCIISGNMDDRVKKVWFELVLKEMRGHWWAKHFYDTRDGSSSARNPYHQWFVNGFMLYGRPASVQTSQKVESPHCMAVVIDEMQEYDKLVWEKLQPAVNDYWTNRQHGAMRKFFGVNSQGRVDNVFYDLAFRSRFYRPHRYVIPSWHNPKYSLSRHLEYLETYDWSVESSRFKQMIRGMTGERSKGLIAAADYNACCLQARDHLGLTDRNILRVDKALWTQVLGDPEQLFTRRLELKSWERDYDMTVLSMDYGSSAPSEIGIWHRIVNPAADATEANRELWVLWLRLTLQGLPGQDQAFIVDYLAEHFKLDWLSIDATGATDVVSQILTDTHNPLYEPRQYRQRLYPAVSNKYIPVRYTASEPEDKALCPAGTRYRKVELAGADGYRLPVWALEQHANVLSSNLVAQLIQQRVLALSGGDAELQQELLSITERIVPGVQPKYEGLYGQHRFSMLRTFAQWYHRQFVLKKLERDMLGEDEWDYTAGPARSLVGIGRVNLQERPGLFGGPERYA